MSGITSFIIKVDPKSNFLVTATLQAALIFKNNYSDHTDFRKLFEILTVNLKKIKKFAIDKNQN